MLELDFGSGRRGKELRKKLDGGQGAIRKMRQRKKVRPEFELKRWKGITTRSISVSSCFFLDLLFLSDWSRRPGSRWKEG